MIKLVFVIRRLRDVPPDEFHRYWLEEHGPLARSLVEPLGCRRYVQSHTIDTGLNAALAVARGIDDAVYDGVAELWWDGSLEELGAGLTTEEAQRAGATLVEDEAPFIDFGRSSIFLTREHTIFD